MDCRSSNARVIVAINIFVDVFGHEYFDSIPNLMSSGPTRSTEDQLLVNICECVLSMALTVDAIAVRIRRAEAESGRTYA